MVISVNCFDTVHDNDISWYSTFHCCSDFLDKFKQLPLTGSVLVKAVFLGAQNVVGPQVIHGSTKKHVLKALARDTGVGDWPVNVIGCIAMLSLFKDSCD